MGYPNFGGGTKMRDRLSSKDLLASFNRWCSVNPVSCLMNPTRFGREMHRKLGCKPTQGGPKDKRVKGFQGIRPRGPVDR